MWSLHDEQDGLGEEAPSGRLAGSRWPWAAVLLLIVTWSVLGGPRTLVQASAFDRAFEALGWTVAVPLESLRGDFAEWTFDGEGVGSEPKGFTAATVGQGSAALWRIQAVAEPASPPHVLTQATGCPRADCLQVLLADGTNFEYPDFSIRLRPATEAKGAGGVIIGARTPRDFYAVLVDFGSNTLEVVRVLDGRAVVLGRGPVKSKEGNWHSLRVQRNTIISKEFIETFYDNTLAVSVEDQALGAGQIGLVTRGEGTVEFDNARAMALYSHHPHSPPAAY